jgi:tetratricopeptide (TPR) repeat protein
VNFWSFCLHLAKSCLGKVSIIISKCQANLNHAQKLPRKFEKILPAEVAACGEWGGLDLPSGFSNLSLDDQVRLVLSAWGSPLPRLLVFDNCEDQALLAYWRPPHGGCQVLVTSRQAKWDVALGVQALQLRVLRRADSVALLRKFRPDLADGEADVIAEELGDLPLALHLAGSFLRTYQHAAFGSPATYLTQLRDTAILEHLSLAGEGATYAPTGHELHVGRTFGLSYDRLDPSDPTDVLAEALLSRAAYFAPGEPIPRALLLATADIAADDFEAALDAERALTRLVELGLLEEEAEGALRLHRLLAAFVRGTTADAKAQGAVEDTVYTEANRLNEAGYPAPLLAWQAHLRSVTDAAFEREDEQAARLCSALDFHLGMIADHRGALSYSERALAIRQKVLGAEHPATALSLNNLGHRLRVQGDLAGARPYSERALRIRQKVLGAEHPATAGSLNNLGSLLYQMGDLAGARPYFERALRIFEKVLGEEHPDTAVSLNNMGMLLQAQGNLAGARSYYERALAIKEQVLGEEHPDTARTLNNLGSLLQAQGDLAGARPYFERALRIFEKVLGEEHPDTATSLNNLGSLLYAMGDLVGARAYHEQALCIREKVLSANHSDTARSIWWIGTLLAQAGDKDGARAQLRRAIDVFTRALGADHPTTRRCQRALDALDAQS